MPLEPVVETYYTDNDTSLAHDHSWNLKEFQYEALPEIEYSQLVMLTSEFKTRHGVVIPLREINNIQAYYKLIADNKEKKGFADINRDVRLRCNFPDIVASYAELQHIRFAFFHAGRYYSLV